LRRDFSAQGRGSYPALELHTRLSCPCAFVQSSPSEGTRQLLAVPMCDFRACEWEWAIQSRTMQCVLEFGAELAESHNTQVLTFIWHDLARACVPTSPSQLECRVLADACPVDTLR